MQEPTSIPLLEFVALKDFQSTLLVRETSVYPCVPVSEECSDALSKPRSEQAGGEWTFRPRNRYLIERAETELLELRVEGNDMLVDECRDCPHSLGLIRSRDSRPIIMCCPASVV